MTPLFEPSSDPFDTVHAALEQAQQQKKNVLIELGGDWCVWCHRLEEYICSHAELLELRQARYITVKVYVGGEANEAADFLELLPPFESVPHLLVYNRRGQLLCSQATDPLEEGDSYNYERVKTFLETWADARLSPYDALPTDELQRRFVRGVLGSDTKGPTLSA